MYVLIERFINRLTLEQVNNFAIKNNLYLSDNEALFVYDFVKKNWQFILSNHGNIDIDRYKEKFSEENFIKIKKLVKEYALKYANYL